jgi:Uma2 family endonuclease
MATMTTAPIGEEAYRELSLGELNGPVELHRGFLREKPGMSATHGDVVEDLADMIRGQVERSRFRVRTQHARLRVSADTYYIPDIAVIPTAWIRPLRGNPRALDAYADPLPLVVEIWSPSTGDYVVDVKIPDYQRRGDLEIWRIQPYGCTVRVWRRQPDGSSAEFVQRGGVLRPAWLADVAIDLDALCAG